LRNEPNKANVSLKIRGAGRGLPEAGEAAAKGKRSAGPGSLFAWPAGLREKNQQFLNHKQCKT
jgi:hypothetical protein